VFVMSHVIGAVPGEARLDATRSCSAVGMTSPWLASCSPERSDP